MKAAKEIINELTESILKNDSQQHRLCFTVALTLLEEREKQIQLDAIREGMRRATKECRKVECTGYGQVWYENRTPKEIEQAILSAAEKLTEKDL